MALHVFETVLPETKPIGDRRAGPGAPQLDQIGVRYMCAECPRPEWRHNALRHLPGELAQTRGKHDPVHRVIRADICQHAGNCEYCLAKQHQVVRESHTSGYCHAVQQALRPVKSGETALSYLAHGDGNTGPEFGFFRRAASQTGHGTTDPGLVECQSTQNNLYEIRTLRFIQKADQGPIEDRQPPVRGIK